MGLTVLEVEVGNPATPEITEKVEFLVDSGAIYSVVPSPVLERLGIRPLVDETFRLADGSKIVRRKGVAVFKHGQRAGGADVIFGEEVGQHAAGRSYAGSSRPVPRSTAAGAEALAHDACRVPALRRVLSVYDRS